MNSAARARPQNRTESFAGGFFALADETFCASRRRLISYLVKLNHALENDLPDLSQALLARFCDSLVDYLSDDLFRALHHLSIPARAHARIAATTEAGMAFDHRYGSATEVRVPAVKDALEQMARVIIERFEVEDELLAPIPGAHEIRRIQDPPVRSGPLGPLPGETSGRC